MSELKPRITENGIDYILVGDYYIPDLKLPEEHRPMRISMSRTAQHGTLFRKAALASGRHTATLDARQTVNAP